MRDADSDREDYRRDREGQRASTRNAEQDRRESRDDRSDSAWNRSYGSQQANYGPQANYGSQAAYGNQANQGWAGNDFRTQSSWNQSAANAPRDFASQGGGYGYGSQAAYGQTHGAYGNQGQAGWGNQAYGNYAQGQAYGQYGAAQPNYGQAFSNQAGQFSNQAAQGGYGAPGAYGTPASFGSAANQGWNQGMAASNYGQSAFGNPAYANQGFSAGQTFGGQSHAGQNWGAHPSQSWSNPATGAQGFASHAAAANQSAFGNQGSFANFGAGSMADRQRGQFTGIGPKGYQRTDERIREDVCDRLTQAGDLDASEIEVAVRDGEVTLTGTVAERRLKREAEDISEECSGVRNVKNEIRIRKERESWASNDIETTKKTSASRGGLVESGDRKSVV